MKANSTTSHDVSVDNVPSHKSCKAMTLTALVATYQRITGVLDSFNDKLPRLSLRLILAFEFWEAGMMKLDGENWFDQLTFPFPFSLLSNDSLWAMGTWLEIIGAIALVVGFGTRFFALSMMILTVVAVNTVHWPVEWHSLAELSKGYTITDSGHGNFKLPLIYLIMFMPLLFGGAGKWSLDYLLKRLYCNSGLNQ